MRQRGCTDCGDRVGVLLIPDNVESRFCGALFFVLTFGGPWRQLAINGYETDIHDFSGLPELNEFLPPRLVREDSRYGRCRESLIHREMLI